MIFLIDYNRTEGRIVHFSSFNDAERSRAHSARLALELELNRNGISREIVLLEANDEEALRRTHRRYFQSAAEIGRSFMTGGI